MPTPALVNMVIGMVLQVEVTSRRSAPCLLASTAGARPTCMPWISPESSTCRPRVPPSMLMTSTLSPFFVVEAAGLAHPDRKDGHDRRRDADLERDQLGADAAGGRERKREQRRQRTTDGSAKWANSHGVLPEACSRLDRAVRLQWVRNSATRSRFNRALGCDRALHVLLDQAPDAVLDRMEPRLALDRQPARPLDRRPG